MLAHLLRCLAAQDTGVDFTYSVTVIDNDAAASARAVAEGAAAETGLAIRYEVGAVNTIPAARNHALRISSGAYVGIIDDDEFPPPDWLRTLYRATRTFGVDGALGPVVPFFEAPPPDWLLKGRFCERPRPHTGTLLKWDQTRTGNVLLKRSVFDDHGLLFDESFTTGGSDREFFKHAMRHGRRFIAVDEAPVYEFVPPERQTKAYWVERALVNGYNAHRNRPPQGLSRLTAPVKAAAGVIANAAVTPVSAALGTHHLIRTLERGGHHASRLCAMMGIQLVKARRF